jgi:hypothetical protein
VTSHQQGMLITIALTLVILLTGCATPDSAYEEKLKKDQYLKHSYPDEPPVSRETPALKTRFYQEIVAGDVVTGMNLTEVKAATQTFPYGSNRYNAVYWCDKKIVNQCRENCNQCASVFFTKQQTHFLQGKGDNPVVVKSLAHTPQDTVSAFRDKPYEVVNAIFYNQAVAGMSINDFKRLRQRTGSKTQYYCKNRRVFESCLYECSDCTLKIISPQNGQYQIRTVRFRGHMDFATVVEVEESMSVSRP